MPATRASRRDFLKGLGLAALGASALGTSACRGLFGAASAVPGKRPPNIVLILADDLGYGDVGCYGSETIRTPHVDALARAGVRFTDFYVNAPVCSPTRAGMLTGRSHLRCGAEIVYTEKNTPERGLPPNETTFAGILQGRGYDAAVFGKWHLGFLPKYNPTHYGFDRFVGHLSGYQDYVSRANALGVYDWMHDREVVQEEGYSTRLITDYAVDYVKSRGDAPFLLYVPYQAPHSPYQGPDDPPLRKAGEAYSRRQEEEERHAKYVEMVEAMDAGVGRIVEALREAGAERDTLVLFLSDNGPSWLAGSTGGLRGGKHSLYEGGIRVPAVAAMPGRIAPGRVCRAPVKILDLFPTFLNMAGAEPPAGVPIDGVDLTALLFANKTPPPRVLCWEYLDWRAVRDGEWKLVMKHDKKTGEYPGELFNLARDRNEEHDVSEERPETVARLRAAHREWREAIAQDPLKRSRENGAG